MPRLAITASVIALAAMALIGGAKADDRSTCFNNRAVAETVVSACSRLIVSAAISPTEKSRALDFRGAASMRFHDLDAAIQDFSASIAINPDNAVAFGNRGFCYQLEGKFDLAIDDYDNAIRLEPGQAIFYSNRGNTWMEKEQYAAALSDYQESIRLNPKNGALYANRARLFRETGELDRALADFKMAIKLEPNLPGAYGGRGLVWRLKNDTGHAIADFNKAISLNPNLPAGYAARGLAYEASGDIENAKRDFATALSKRTGVSFGLGAETRIDISGDRFKRIARARLAVLTQQRTEAAPTPGATSKEPSATTVPKNQPGVRLALVIGNGAYPEVGRLANPPNDARAMARSLRAMDFDVTEGIDLDLAGFERTVRDFLLKAAKVRIVVVFYAGHGVQIDGRNYLVPIDAKIAEGNDFAAQMTSLDTILAGLDDQIRTNIVILDACRNNPLAPQEVTQVVGPGRSLSVSSGLAATGDLGKGATLGAGTLLAFATAPGQVAFDGGGDHSPFSTALLRHLPTPGLEIQTMLTRVRAEVVSTTRNKQIPWSNSSLLGEVYLAGNP